MAMPGTAVASGTYNIGLAGGPNALSTETLAPGQADCFAMGQQVALQTTTAIEEVAMTSVEEVFSGGRLISETVVGGSPIHVESMVVQGTELDIHQSYGNIMERRKKHVIQEVPQIEVRQEIHEVVRPIIEERITQVPKMLMEQQVILQQKATEEIVEKYVEVPSVDLVETVEEVLIPLIQERIVEVPETNLVELVRQVPKVEFQEVCKEVALPIMEGRERVVEVPHVLQQEVLQEIPQMQTVDVKKEVMKQVVQKVPKMVEKLVTTAREKNCSSSSGNCERADTRGSADRVHRNAEGGAEK
jgi:hypothetical protein